MSQHKAIGHSYRHLLYKGKICKSLWKEHPKEEIRCLPEGIIGRIKGFMFDYLISVRKDNLQKSTSKLLKFILTMSRNTKIIQQIEAIIKFLLTTECLKDIDFIRAVRFIKVCLKQNVIISQLDASTLSIMLSLKEFVPFQFMSMSSLYSILPYRQSLNILSLF